MVPGANINSDCWHGPVGGCGRQSPRTFRVLWNADQLFDTRLWKQPSSRCEMWAPAGCRGGAGFTSRLRGIMGMDQEVLHHMLHLPSQGNLFKDLYGHMPLRKCLLHVWLRYFHLCLSYFIYFYGLNDHFSFYSWNMRLTRCCLRAITALGVILDTISINKVASLAIILQRYYGVFAQCFPNTCADWKAVSHVAGINNREDVKDH